MKKIMLFLLILVCLCLTSCKEPSVHYKQAEDINKIHDYYLFVYGDEFTHEKNEGTLPENLKYEMTDNLNIEAVVFPTAVIVNCEITYSLCEELNRLFKEGIVIIFFNSDPLDGDFIFSKDFEFCEYNSNPNELYFNLYFDYAKSKSYSSESGGTVTELLMIIEDWLNLYR